LECGPGFDGFGGRGAAPATELVFKGDLHAVHKAPCSRGRGLYPSARAQGLLHGGAYISASPRFIVVSLGVSPVPGQGCDMAIGVIAAQNHNGFPAGPGRSRQRSVRVNRGRTFDIDDRDGFSKGL